MFDLPGLRRHLPLAVALGVDSIGTGISGPLLLLFLTRVADVPLAQAGLTLSATFAVALIVPAIVGQVVTRLGGRNVLLAAQVLQAVGLSGLLVARDLPAIAACTLVAAIGQRAFWSSVFAVIADASDSGPADDKDRWFALTNMVQNTGYALGALTAGALLLIPGDLPYLLAIGTNAACFAISALLLLSYRPNRAEPAATRAGPPAAPPRAHRVPSWPYLGLGAPATLIVPGLVLSVLVYSVAELLHGPRSIAYAADAAPPGQRSTYLSWFQYSFALANIAAPGVFAASFTVDPGLPWAITSVVALVACAGLALVAKALPPRARRP